MVTMGQIAKKAGVSQATVSRVLSGRSVGFISDATRQRVREAALELGFKNPGEYTGEVESNVRGRSGVVSIWVAWPMDTWSMRIVTALIGRAWDDGYEGHIRPLLTDDDPRRAAFAWPVDGIFVLGAKGLDGLATHRRLARPRRNKNKDADAVPITEHTRDLPASVLTVRGRAVPVMVVGVEGCCKGVDCPPEFDAVRCNPDEGSGQDCNPDAIASAAWTQLRRRIVGPAQDHPSARGSSAKDASPVDRRGVHIWVSETQPSPAVPAEPAADPGGKKSMNLRLYPVVDREPRLQSADVNLV